MGRFIGFDAHKSYAYVVELRMASDWNTVWRFRVD